MSNQLEIKQRIRSIAVQLENGLSNAEIIEQGVAQWNISARTLERYIALAKDVVAEKIDSMDAIIEAVRGAVVAEEAEKNLRSNMELESKIIAMLEGEMEVEKIVTGPNGTTEIKSKPSRTVLLKAIDLIWKRRGQYRSRALPKVEMTASSAIPPIIVDSEEAKKLVEKIAQMP